MVVLLHDHCPGLRVVALSSQPEVRQVALDAEADAFVSKGDPPERLLRAMVEIHEKTKLKGDTTCGL